jgi:protein-tyrosine phosphatase
VRERTLEWEDLRNARDLGGLPVAGGGTTRFGSIVRSDTLRQLTPRGWSSLAAYGVRTTVDLRFQVEIDANEPLDSGPGGLSRCHARSAPDADGRPADVHAVAVSVLGEPDRRLGEHFDAISRAEPDAASSTRAVYLEMLARFQQQLAAAVAAVADAQPGGVLVHCHAGKDRTGLVVALMLAVSGVEPDAIAADYALSGPNLASSLAGWIGSAEAPEEREQRRRVGLAPERAMADVLIELDDRYGGAVSYLLSGGLPEGALTAIRNRLVAAAQE